MGEKFLNIDNFTLAYRRLQTYVRDYYKEIYINDLNNFGLNLNTNIKTLISRIERNIYKPANANKIYMPKPDGTVRPITVISFIDLLIYQAIINVLADGFYDEFKYKTNIYIFGNIYKKMEKEEEQIFFYVPWKKQWKKYNQISLKHFKDGFKYKCEFDLASFYDTIDHSILIRFIEEKISDRRLIDILKAQLITWSCDHDRIAIHKSHGIPQGAKPSGFLAEIILNYIDEKMIKLVNKDPTIKYLRYVDDIRLFTLNEDHGRRVLAYLDLLSRDLGLIPQASKVGIKLINNQGDIANDNRKISEMSLRYNRKKELSDSDNKKLIKDIKKNLTIDKIRDRTYDRTIIKFALFRIKADDGIKNILIENIDNLYDCIYEICYYLSNKFVSDPSIKKFANDMIIRGDIPYNYVVAIIFKYFYKHINFDNKIYSKYYIELETKNWYIRYFMIDWIYFNSPGILNTLPEDENEIVERKAKHYKYKYSEDDNVKHIIIKSMIENENIETALEGHKLIMGMFFRDIYQVNNNSNEFIKSIYDMPIEENYITISLKEKYGIDLANKFFNEKYWNYEEITYINIIFKSANDISESDPSIWLNYINSFNHLVTVKLLETHGYENFNKKEYSNILDKDNFMIERFPKTYDCFCKINRRRHEVPSSHPYSNDGNIGRYIDKANKTMYEQYFKLSMEEILIYFQGKDSSEKNELALISI